jgi:pyridinium-3,5-bisthiocarboxylic acid mononucleotide nickel chelatase
MRMLYYDCAAGISGDMNLAAMLDLGVSPEYLRVELSKLGLDREFRLEVSRDARKGIAGTRVDVVVAQEEHGHGHNHGHAHRRLRDIEAIVEASTLSEPVRRTSLEIFRTLAAAEAKVHGTTLDEVHFHEVGATDAIVDIVGAAICRHSLEVDAVWASPVELGGGFVQCAHGRIPVPAPATVAILEGRPTTRGAVGEETATPTGAAILAVLADRFVETPAMVVEKTAYGIGHRDPAIANVLRLQLARDTVARDGARVRAARLLVCNIDDMTAEALGVAMDVLLAAGAMDVHFTPILMKKNRPATCLSVLCGPEDEERFKALLFAHTTTLGLKSFALEKTELETAFAPLDTPLGPVTMKNALLGGRVIRSKPELEECRALAERHGLSLAEVYACVAKARK